MLRDPRAVPGKTIDYAKYDLVLLFNPLMEALHVSESVVERLAARLMAVPARPLPAHAGGVSFGVSDRPAPAGRAWSGAATRARSWCSGNQR